MIDFLLDTDTCIYTIKQKPTQVIEKLQTLSISDVGISAITLSELEYGVSRSARPEQNKLALTQFVAPLEILPYDDMAAAWYGRIRADLESQGTPIGPLDTLIAAHALALECILVTKNESEFSRIPGLAIESWAA